MFLRVAGVIVALVAVALGATMLLLQTRWGGERLRRQIVVRLNRQIQGELGVGRLSFGGNGLTVWDVSLRGPDGNPVAQVARAEVDFRIRRLLHREVRLTALVVESPRLWAESDPGGLNLSRALAPRRTPTAKAPPRPRPLDEGWVIRLDRFELRDGAFVLASTDGTKPKQLLHFETLQSLASLRYATGDGSTDLAFRLDGRSALPLGGPLAITADASVRGDRTRFTLDGELLGGTIRAHADVDSRHLRAADALIAITIPRMELGGYGWGPLHVDGRASPGTIPDLDLALAIPGLELTAQGKRTGAPGGTDVFKLDARLALDDLGRTGKALQALTTAPVRSLAGKGDLRLTIEGPMASAPGTWRADCKGLFRDLRFADKTLTDLAIEGHAANLAKIPGQADVTVTAASVMVGARKLGKVELDAKVRQQALSLTGRLASPEPVNLAVAGAFDGDRRGLALSHISLSYPKVAWISDGLAHLRFEGQKLSLVGLRLQAGDQRLAVDGSKDDEHVDGHLALAKFRLDLLPTLIAPTELNLGGLVDLDVKAEGAVDDPQVVAHLALVDGRVRTFSKIDASIVATLAKHRLEGTLSVSAPYLGMNGGLQLPVDPRAGGALALNLAVERLDLAAALRGSGTKPELAGRLTARLRVSGSAADPKVAGTVSGHDLNLKRPASATEGPNTIEMGHASIRLAYQDRTAHADVDFASAQGGELRVDLGAKVNLGYPTVTEGFDTKKIPIHGKVVAKNFDVAWIARFDERVETLGGKVSADAKVAGTVGDPLFIGDIRWKNGKLVTVAPSKSAARRQPVR